MIPAPECLLKEVASGVYNNCSSYTAKYQDHIPCSFAYKLVCVDDKYSIFSLFLKNMNIVRV